jgi:hypothetical protein
MPHYIQQKHFRIVNKDVKNKKRDMEASDDDNEYDEDYKDGGRSHDALLRKIGMLRQRCIHQN